MGLTILKTQKTLHVKRFLISFWGEIRHNPGAGRPHNRIVARPSGRIDVRSLGKPLRTLSRRIPVSAPYLRSLASPNLKPGRPRRVARPALETLEDRAVPTGSIMASFGGLNAPVSSVTLPQPTSNGEQSLTMTLPASSAIPTLFQDVASGKHINPITITLDQVGNQTTDTITLTDALIGSIQTVSNPSQTVPTFVVTVVGRATPPGSITASFGGLAAPVINVTLTPALSSVGQTITLTLAVSSATPTLFQDVASGKHINPVTIALISDGNGATDTLTLEDAAITSFRLVNGSTGQPTDVVTVTGLNAPVPKPTATVTFDGSSPPVLGVVLAPPSSGVQQATITLGLSAEDVPLIIDAILGRPIKTVSVVQSEGDGPPVTTILSNALITSFRLALTPSGNRSVVITLVGEVATPLPT